jgi:hypothetical protein
VLAVMAIIDPVMQRVRSVEVLCFQTTTNLQLIPETQMVLLTCVPPPNVANPGPSSVRAFTLEAGTLVEQWSFYSAQGETFVTSVAPTMVFVAAATGTVQQPAAYYVSIDLQGNATLLAPIGNVPTFSTGQTYSVACTPSGLVGLVTQALATVAQVNVAAATLTFVTSYAPASPSNFFAVTAFMSGGVSYLMPYESDYVYYHVLNGTSGAQLLLVPTSAYANPNIAAIKISHDPTAKLVMISGLGGIVGISFAQPAAPSVVFITTDNAMTAAELVPGRALIARQGDYLIAFSTAPGRTWHVSIGNSLANANVGGVTYVIQNVGIFAYGATGTMLWFTPYKFVGVGTINGPFFMSRYVVVFVGASLIAFDQYSGAYQFTRNIQANDTSALSPICGLPLAVQQQGAVLSNVIQGNNSLLVLASTNPCAYVVLADFTITGVEMAGGFQTSISANGDFFTATYQTVARISGTTGKALWTQDLYAPLAQANQLTMYVSANLLYTSAYVGVACHSASLGFLLWGTTTLVVPTAFAVPLVADDILLIPSQTQQQPQALSLYKTVLLPNGTATLTQVWTVPLSTQLNAGTVAGGVVLVLGGLTAPNGDYCENCVSGFSAINGSMMWATVFVGYCGSMTNVIDNRAVQVSCADLLYVSPLSGRVLFGAGNDGTVLGLYGGVLTFFTSTGVTSRIGGSLLPAAALALVDALVPAPVPPPFVLPSNYTPPANPAVPPPVLNGTFLFPAPDVAWSFARSFTPQLTQTQTSNAFIDNIFLSLGPQGSTLSFIDGTSGAYVRNVTAAEVCQDSPTSNTLLTSGKLFIVICSSDVRSYNTSGAQVWRTSWAALTTNVVASGTGGLAAVRSQQYYTNTPIDVITPNGTIVRPYFSVQTLPSQMAMVYAAQSGNYFVSLRLNTNIITVIAISANGTTAVESVCYRVLRDNGAACGKRRDRRVYKYARKHRGCAPDAH